MKYFLRHHFITVLVLSVLLISQSFSQFPVWQKKLSGHGEAVAINPLNHNTVYAQGIDGWLYISHNQGNAWTAVTPNIPFGTREIIVHPNDTLTLFAVAFSGGLLRSTNGGGTWTSAIPGYGGIDGESVTYDPTHPDTMYAGDFGPGDVYKSTNRGATWVLRGTVSSNLCALAVRPDSSNILLAGSGAGRISKSTNGGATWHLVKSAGSTEIPKIVINHLNPQIAYATAFEGSQSDVGVWKSTNGGESWSLTALQQVNVWALDIDQTNPSVLYTGSFDEQYTTVYRTTDGGTTWTGISRGFLTNNAVWNLKIDPTDNTTVYTAITSGSFGFNGIFKLETVNAGIEGIVRDSINHAPITTGITQIQPTGESFNLSATLGGFSTYREAGDTTTSRTFSVYLSGQLFKQQAIGLINDSILHQDILVRLGSIRGTVFNDTNHNGVRDGGEPGLSGWTIKLSGLSAATTISDLNGDYVFNDLFPGSYTISEQSKNGYTLTLPVPSSYAATVSSVNREFTGKDFGNYLNHAVLSVSPKSFSSTNPRNVSMQATFDTAMNVSLFNDSTSWVVRGSKSGLHKGSFAFSGANTTVTFTPVQSFQYGEVVTVDITNSLKTASGGLMTPYEFQFTVESNAGPGVFDVRNDVQVGANPYAVTLADIDGDGDNDIVTANFADNTITVLKNNGDGTFGNRFDYGCGVNPSSILLTDVDNDGDLDVVTVNAGISTISVLKNNGSGVFGPQVEYSDGGLGLYVTSADVNGDGYPDISVEIPGSSLVSVLMNNKTGGFPSYTPYFMSGSPWGAAMGDLTNDGASDIATVNAGPTSTISTLENLGNGAFAIQLSYAAGTNAHAIILTDITSDQKPNLIVTNSGSNSITIYPYNGGLFGPPSDIATGVFPWGLAAVDIQGDSLSDIVVANLTAQSITFLKNMGGGAFMRKDIGVGSLPRSVAIGDVDCDGGMDIVVANSGADSVSVLIQTSSYPLTFASGWNLISLPLLPCGFTKYALYPTATSKAFAYQGQYVAKDTLLFGIGYWLKYSTLESREFNGNLVLKDTVMLSERWNMIGGISVPISTTNVGSDPSGIINSKFYGYNNGSYYSTDSLRPGKGYWVKMAQAGKLILDPAASSALALDSPQSDLTAQSHWLKFEDAQRHTQTLYFSPSAQASSVLDRYELPPLPPNGLSNIRFASQRMLEAAPPSGSQTFSIEMNNVEYPLTLSWNVSNDNDHQWSLSTGRSRHSLGGDGKLTLQAEPDKGLHLDVTTLLREIPSEYSLEQNYPNPFNPSTEIRYGLPTASRVTLTVVNILGQEIARLVNEPQDAGYHSITWTPNVGSGTYFYKLQATNMENPASSFVQIRKMELIK